MRAHCAEFDIISGVGSHSLESIVRPMPSLYEGVAAACGEQLFQRFSP